MRFCSSLFAFTIFCVGCTVEIQILEVQTTRQAQMMIMKADEYLHREKSMQKSKWSHVRQRGVRFAKEKDETWLAKRVAMTIFTKIHMTFVWRFVIPLLQRRCLPHNSFNMSIHEKNKELVVLQYSFDRIKEPRNNLSPLVKHRVWLQWQPYFQFVKMAMFVMCQHAVSTFDPRQLKCMLVQSTNLAIALS